MAFNLTGINALRRRSQSPAGLAFRLGRSEERRLIQAARTGDARALGRLVTLLSGPVYRYGRSFCGDHHDAEDVSQAVFLALVRTLDDFRGDASLATWTYTVARRACMRMRRVSRHAPAIESLEAATDAGARPPSDRHADPARDAERADLRTALEREIRALPAGQREVIVLRDVEGLPARRVASLMRISERAVKARLHRARATLREALAAHIEPRRRRGPREGAPRHRPAPAAARCPDTARLVSRYLEGELDAAACERLHAHVDGCPDCGAACERLRIALDACRAFGHSTPPPAIAARVREALREMRTA